jgi:hypothetical protein
MSSHVLFRTNLSTACKYMSPFPVFQHQNVTPKWVNNLLQYASKFTILPPQGIWPKLLNYGLQVNLDIVCFTVSMCNSMLSQVQSSVSHHYCFQVHCSTFSSFSSNCTPVQSAPRFAICLSIVKLRYKIHAALTYI